MASRSLRNRLGESTNIWPGFVDADIIHMGYTGALGVSSEGGFCIDGSILYLIRYFNK